MDKTILWLDTNTWSLLCRYNTYRMGGEKFLLLSTQSWLGGKNYFLGIAYVAVGGACLLFCLLLFGTQLIFRRRLGDVSKLSWNYNNKIAAM